MTLTASEPGATYRVVTARKPRHCDDRFPLYPNVCSGYIKPGEQYIRAVMFPNHDIYAYIDRLGKPLRRPVVHALCFGCADGRFVTGLLVIDARKGSRRA